MRHVGLESTAKRGSGVVKGEIQGVAHENTPSPPDLVEVAAAWSGLSDPIKAAVLALVRSAMGRPG